VEQDTGYDLFGVCVYMCVCVSDRGGGVDVGIWITGVYKNRTRTQQQWKKGKVPVLYSVVQARPFPKDGHVVCTFNKTAIILKCPSCYEYLKYNNGQ